MSEADDLIAQLREARTNEVIASQRCDAAREWVELCDLALVKTQTIVHDLFKQLRELTDIERDSTFGDIYRHYGVQREQLKDGLPTVDPREVVPELVRGKGRS